VERLARVRVKVPVDFALVRDGRLEQMIEVKSADPDLGRGIAYYAKRFPEIPAVQLVLKLRQPRTVNTL
jgi:hypothetical protein